jgi:hypothetical protein
VRRAVLQEAVVIRVRAFAPAAFGVVAGLFGKQRALLRLEVNGAFAVGIALGIVEDVHEYDIMPRPTPSGQPPAVPSVNVSAPNRVPDDDAYWQRPDSGNEAFRPGPSTPPTGRVPEYSGPPRADPPSANWRPPVVSQPPPPRSMPAQSMDALGEAERSARTVTFGIGLVAGAIALILMCLLCARAIF